MGAIGWGGAQPLVEPRVNRVGKRLPPWDPDAWPGAGAKALAADPGHRYARRGREWFDLDRGEHLDEDLAVASRRQVVAPRLESPKVSCVTGREDVVDVLWLVGEKRVRNGEIVQVHSTRLGQPNQDRMNSQETVRTEKQARTWAGPRARERLLCELGCYGFAAHGLTGSIARRGRKHFSLVEHDFAGRTHALWWNCRDAQVFANDTEGVELPAIC